MPFDAIVTAETAGFYKPDVRTYRAGCEAVGKEPSRVLFIAGSPHDVPGASAAGMDVFWANRRNKPAPDGPQPIATAPTLERLPTLLQITR